MNDWFNFLFVKKVGLWKKQNREGRCGGIVSCQHACFALQQSKFESCFSPDTGVGSGIYVISCYEESSLKAGQRWPIYEKENWLKSYLLTCLIIILILSILNFTKQGMLANKAQIVPVVVVRWAACSYSTQTIQVWIPLKSIIFYCVKTAWKNPSKKIKTYLSSWNSS